MYKGSSTSAALGMTCSISQAQGVRSTRCELLLGRTHCRTTGDADPDRAWPRGSCRSGKRSLEAGKALVQAGLKAVYHVDEGFEGDLDEDHHRSSKGGWRFRGLPWEQC